MKIAYKNDTVERVVMGIKAATSLMVLASFVLLFGFYERPVPAFILYGVQIGLLTVFLVGKGIRLLNARSKKEYLLANWYEIPMLVALAVAVIGAEWWSDELSLGLVRHAAIGVYLIFEVTVKLFMALVGLAATGRNPTKMLIGSFVLLIVSGAGLLMLPRSTPGTESLRFVDALFTATSATCITGLVVKDTGGDFTFMGQTIILTLIQLGGLGILVFGAVIALLLGQAFSVRESVALQDLLSARTLGRIGSTIFFIFVVTISVEALGALALLPMWNNVATWDVKTQSSWFYSIFHSISAFCNAGFGLFGDSLIRYDGSWQVYGVICPLIILGGLGFGVLYNLANVANDRLGQLFRRHILRRYALLTEPPTRLRLQAKIVLSATVVLIVAGAAAIWFFERYSSGSDPGQRLGILGAFFQSVTARTAGFNTVPIGDMTESSKLVLILLMFVGGGPGSTAGGIKNVTLVVILTTVVAMLRKRSDVEIFGRSIRTVVVKRAVTIFMLFAIVLLTATLTLSVTESPYSGGFTTLDMLFEAASALGTVGLTTGVTPTLTDAGKLVIILVMLIGRLGPLTLVAALTFNLKPARYSYPDEPVIVG